MAEREHRVLFVDDEPNILRTLRRLCRREPYEVLVADSGAAALDILHETPASVIVSDYRMPGMTGVEMLARAKEIDPESIRIILSGYADTQAVLEAVNTGEVYRFLAKPWNDQELLTTINQSLEHWDLRRHAAELEKQLMRQNAQLLRLNENLEHLVSERTRSLSLAQDVLENLPIGVVGVSSEGELMLANSFVASRWPEIGRISPGTDVDDALPVDILSLVRACLVSGEDTECHHCPVGGDTVHVTINRLADRDQDRGCIVVLRPLAGARV